MIERAALLSQLEMVQHGLSSRNILEQSSSFVFSKGRVMTYNEEIACIAECDLPKEITCAVVAKPLLELLHKMKEDHIEVFLNEKGLNVKGKRKVSTFRIDEEILLPIDSIESPAKSSWIDLPDTFGEGISLASKCCVTQKTALVILQSIHITANFIQAMDNYQIFHFPISLDLEEDLVVRANAVKHASALGMVKMAVTENMVHFQNKAKMQMSIRRYCDEFPDVLEYLDIPGDKITLPKSLSEAADRASVFVGEDLDGRVTVTCTENKIRIDGTGSAGTHKEAAAAKYNGPPLKFAISPKLLSEIISRGVRCVISENKIRVVSKAFIYVTCLSEVD